MLTVNPSQILKFFIWASFVVPALVSMRLYEELVWSYPGRASPAQILLSLVEGRVVISTTRVVTALALLAACCFLWGWMLRAIEETTQKIFRIKNPHYKEGP